MNIITSICIILIGLLLSLILPKWVKFGNKKKRNKYQFYLNITGIITIIIGVINLYWAIKELFSIGSI